MPLSVLRAFLLQGVLLFTEHNNTDYLSTQTG